MHAAAVTLFGPAAIKWLAALIGVPLIFAGLLRLQDNQAGGIPRVLAGVGSIAAAYWITQALLR